MKSPLIVFLLAAILGCQVFLVYAELERQSENQRARDRMEARRLTQQEVEALR